MAAPVLPRKDRPVIQLDVGAEHGFPQAGFYGCGHRLPAYFSGVGGGKTTALVVSGFAYAGKFPGSVQVLTEPSFSMVGDVLIPKIDALFGHLRAKLFTVRESPPPDVRFQNGSELWLRSTEVNERLYGPDVARVLMDEVTLGQQEAPYNILLGRLRQPGFPHQLLVTGTPKGRNWVWQRYFGSPEPEMHVFQAESGWNQHLPNEYVSDLQRAYGGAESPLARQELGGSWLEMAGQVFPQFSRHLHLSPSPLGRAPWKRVLGGIDFGAVSPTALVVVAEGAGGRLHALAEWYRHEAAFDELVEEVGRLGQEYGIRRWVCDPAGKREIAALQHAGVRAQAARHGNRLPLRVGLVAARLSVGPDKLPGLFIDPACANLCRELEGLSWRREKLSAGSSGQVREEFRDAFERGQPDHAFDALANAISEFDAVAAPFKHPPPRLLWEEGA